MHRLDLVTYFNRTPEQDINGEVWTPKSGCKLETTIGEAILNVAFFPGDDVPMFGDADYQVLSNDWNEVVVISEPVVVRD